MKNIIKTALFLVLILITGACSTERLDLYPTTQLEEQFVFDNADRIEAQVNGLYDFMKAGAYLGGRFHVYNDVRADNFIPKSTNGVTNYQTWNHTVISTTNEVQNLWTAVYNAVNAINIFLDGIDKNWASGKLDGIITQTEKDNYVSEALTLRAICYFQLLQMYSRPYAENGGSGQGVPLRLKSEKTSENNDLAPATVAQTYAQVLKDLNDAEPLAINSYGNDALLNATRVHRNTIIAFKTRVYLVMQNYAGVLTESAKIVPATAPFRASSGVALALNASFANIFAAPYTSSEIVLTMPMTTSDNPGTQNGLAHYHSPSSSESYYLVSSAGSLLAGMNAADARRSLMQTVDNRTFVGKWRDYTGRADYAPVMRYAEVLLSRAEAIVRNGGAVTQEAVDLLNAVRTRSYPGGAYNLAGFASPDAFFNAVLLERNMEFLGEGIRNLDLMRLRMSIPAKSGGSMGNVAIVAPGSSTYIWPVPGNELTFNKLMTPNN